MSSGFSGGVPELYGGAGGINTGRSTMMLRNNCNNRPGVFSQVGSGQSKMFADFTPTCIPMNNAQSQIQFPHRSSILPDGASQNLHRGTTFVGKRSLTQFQQQQQFQFLQQQQVQQGLGFYLRNVKPRSYQQASPISPLLPPVDFSSSSSSIISSECSSVSPINWRNRSQPVIPSENTNVTRVLSSGNPNCSAVASYLNQVQNSLYQESEEKKIMNQLQELEKQLLDDNDEDEDDTVSILTNNEWSETINNLITRSGNQLSPASSTSSCSSSMESPPISSPKQSIIEAATAISEGKTNVAIDILTRLAHASNGRISSEQRLTSYMVSALRSRVNSTEYPPPVLEMQSKEHAISAQYLYEVSPCFKLGFMAANLAILEAVTDHPSNKLHVIDFDIVQGEQYWHLLHALAAKKTDKPATLKITGIMGREFVGERVKAIGNELKTLANKLGVCFIFNIVSCKITDLSREKLGVEDDEALAVNFAYKLYKVPDESVTTENLRDELLRRVKGLSPKLVILVEQELNANTAAFVARVKEACGYYGALLDSLNATASETVRVKIEEGLNRKIANSVACEGRDRVERCEVFGKWRARMSMAGFGPRPMNQLIVESLLKKINSGPRGNPGCTVKEQSGGICFAWMGKTLTVASAWC
ncbi:scarecrow-like protein 8 [Lycium ferocissimum]|uniref:scarecrow-like protein 8 n=1 Tax=Lycium ferocissimum TaxID=112874 RepID=UPI002815A156|nr:scarecrow-like protein 8 [Lycium ferocissimum]